MIDETVKKPPAVRLHHRPGTIRNGTAFTYSVYHSSSFLSMWSSSPVRMTRRTEAKTRGVETPRGDEDEAGHNGDPHDAANPDLGLLVQDNGIIN